MDESICVLEGTVSVSAAINAKKRKIELCYIDAGKIAKRDRKLCAFLGFLKANGIKTELCERETIEAFLSENAPDAGKTHGGVAAICGKRSFMTETELIEKTKNEAGFCVVLDGVEDPFNFGYSVRNLYAAGCSGIFIPKRNWMTSAGVCARASAGATELCDIAVMDDDEEAFLQKLKNGGLSVVCAAKTGSCTELFDFVPDFPLALFIGGEKRGISPRFIENADHVVSIPYFSDAKYSLPTASTAAVFGFELGKQR